MVGVAGLMWWNGSWEEPPLGPAVAHRDDAAPPIVAKARPDVLFILWDTVRADRVSAYGHDRPTTPHLERLARGARLYERAQSPGMWTVPAHGSMFTGLSVPSHGARVGWLWLDEHHTTLAEHFREHGYATLAWSANPYLSPATNLLQGFDDVRLTWLGDDAAPCAAATRGKLLPEDASVAMSPAFQGDAEGWAEHLTVAKDCAPRGMEAVLEALDQHDEPVFAYVNLLEAHHPRLPSLASRQAVLPEGLLKEGLHTDGSLRRLMGAMEGKESFTDAENQALLGVYDASLRDLDDALGQLLDGLEARQALHDTVVVVVSDHGEHFGEDGRYDHRWSVHQALLHVPLVVHGPGIAAEQVAEPVSTMGLYGSLPALAGLPMPRPDAPTLDARGPVFSALVAPTPRLPEVMATWPDLPPRRWQVRYGAVVDGPLKLIRDDRGGESLFDVLADPLQTRPLARPADSQRLGEMLATWRRTQPPYDRSKRTAADQPGQPMKEDAATREQLQALGYMGDE